VRLLIANRGEIARRILRTARSMGIETVAVYAEGDRDAPFVHESDYAFALPGRSAVETYLNIEVIIAAAQKSGSSAVHPGYGFLSERAAFAEAVIQAGLIWVGPLPPVIAAMGDKVAAKRLMEEAGVPVLPTWHPDDKEVSFPILVKASAGGGGKGMRIVESADALSDAVASARREAEAAFGDPTVFLERYVTEARHVEIQLIADNHGHVVHLGERECSIQRRHQKIIEESPSPGIDAATRHAMCDAAVSAGRAVAYSGAGTVEFVVEPSGAFWFLEVNTRLQVEHPVTEAVTGIDLVREQLRVAQGAPLSFTQDSVKATGHAIEARVYAEDPSRDFLPATGTLVEWTPTESPSVRWDSGVETGSDVAVEFDPMLAKVIAHAPTRSEAALALALALRRSRIRGVVTNRDFLVGALRRPEFLDGLTTTDFIERIGIKTITPQIPPAQLFWAATAAALQAETTARRSAVVLTTLPSGWRNGPMPAEQRCFTEAAGDLVVDYRLRRDGRFDVTIGDWTQTVECSVEESGWMVLASREETERRHVRVAGDKVWVQGPDGDIELRAKPRFPEPESGDAAGGLTAPMPGSVLAVEVAVGDQVEQSALLVIIEAMKMEHRVVAPYSGTVTEVKVARGSQVGAGDLLIVLEP
jgi:propionyl-CoA carboxylase alpha chain